MPEQSTPQVFISYSRKDSETVEKLAASLLIMGFSPWVDRNRIEGGMRWEQVIAKAIEESAAVVLVLTPDSAQSPYVNFEVTRAQQLKKFIEPLLYKPVAVSAMPMSWGAIQYVDMQANYDQGLMRLDADLRRGSEAPAKDTSQQGAATGQRPLLGRLMGKSPTVPQEPQLTPEEVADIYRRAAYAIETGDLERADRLLRQILDDNPRALNGTVQSKLQEIQPALKRQRISRLVDEMEKATGGGDWRQEYALLERLQGFRNLSQAESARMEQARRNREYQNTYNIIVGLVADGSKTTAISDLRNLWRQAKGYGDPEGLAEKLGILTPEGEKLRDETCREAEGSARSAAQAADAADAVVQRVKATMSEATSIKSAVGSEEAAKLLGQAEVAQNQVVDAASRATAAKNAAASAAERAKQAQARFEKQSLDQAQSAALVAEAEAKKAAAAQLDAERIAKESLISTLDKLKALKREHDNAQAEMVREQELHTPKGFVRIVFRFSSRFDMWAAATCLLSGAAGIEAVVTHSVLSVVGVLACLAILSYVFGYVKVLDWYWFLIAVAVSAGLGALVAWQAAFLTPPPVHGYALFGVDTHRITPESKAPFVIAYAEVWAVLGGAIGAIAGVASVSGRRKSTTQRRASRRRSSVRSVVSISGWRLFTARTFSGIGWGIGGAVLGALFGAALSFPIVALGWVYGGIAVGGSSALIVTALAFADGPRDAEFGMITGIVVGGCAAASAVAVVLFAVVLSQPWASGWAWAVAAVLGGAAVSGIMTTAVVVVAARTRHP